MSIHTGKRKEEADVPLLSFEWRLPGTGKRFCINLHGTGRLES